MGVAILQIQSSITAEMRNKTLVILGLVALVATATAQLNPADSALDERSGIMIHFGIEQGMFPSSWVGGEVKAKAVPLDQDQITRATSLMKTALGAYPTSTLKSNLKRVYVSKLIEFFGLEYGGTNSLDTVYITQRTPKDGYSNQYVVGCFHHEFSSILLRNHPSYFDEIAWAGANEPNFKYGAGGTEALRTGQASTKYNAQLAEKGFLTQYSKASVEEDFNMIAEGLFSGDEKFWEIVDHHERVRTKAKIVIQFYSKLDSSFSEAGFRAKKPTQED